MDFVRPPYRTIADAEREEREALEKKVAESEKALAAKDAELARIMAKNAELEAALAAK